MAFARTPHWNPATHRRLALCSALAMWAEDLPRLTALHPDGERVRNECQGDTPTTLDRLLWDELEARESMRRRKGSPNRSPAAQPRTAAGYALRRRQLAVQSESQTLVAVLPDLWRVLMDRKPAEVEAFAVRVGLACLALAQGLDREADSDAKPPAFTLDEGTDYRVRRITSSLDDEVTIDAGILKGWRSAFAKQSQRSSVDKALRALGMSVLSGLFQHLPTATRAAMGRHFKSSLCVSLASGRPLHRYTADDAEPLEKTFVRLFGHEEDHRPPTHPAPPSAENGAAS